MSVVREQMLRDMLGFSVGTIPFTYLGCPVFKGKPKSVYFLANSDKIKMKLATWKGSLLSIMGRVQLVKSIIHGMLVYSFHVYMWPRRLLNDLDKSIKKRVNRLSPHCNIGHFWFPHCEIFSSDFILVNFFFRIPLVIYSQRATS